MLQIEFSRGDPGTEHLIKALDQFKPTVGQEFLDWQTEDMNRNYPTLAAGETHWGADDSSWVTLIYPRSRLSSKRRRAGTSGAGRARRSTAAPRVVRKGVITVGRRPILRAELFDKLRERMRALLSKLVS